MSDDAGAALTRTAMMLFLQGKVDEALACFDRAIAQDPRSASPRVLKANLVGLFDKEAAIGLLMEAVELEPGYGHGWATLGAILVDAGRLSDGLEACRTALSLDRRQPTAWYSQGMGLVKTARQLKERGEQALTTYDDALVSLHAALYLQPDNASAWYEVGYTLAEELGMPGGALACFHQSRLLKHPQGEQAVATATRAVARRLADPRTFFEKLTLVSRAERLRRLATAALAADDWANALTSSDVAVGFEPDKAASWIVNAKALERVGYPGHMACAAAAYRRAQALDPNDTEARLGAARGLAFDGWFAEAREALLAVEPQVSASSQHVLYTELAIVEYSLDRHADALAHIEQALAAPKAEPSSLWYLKGLVLASGLKRDRDALPVFEKAAQLGDDRASAKAEECRKRLANLPVT